MKKKKKIKDRNFSQSEKEKICRKHMGLVVLIARKYVGFGLGLDDLIQEGALGLLRAMKTFNRRKKCKFTTYATWWIRNYMQRALDNNARTIRLPVNIISDLVKYRRNRGELLQKFGREPSTEEVAVKMGVEIKHIKKMERISRIPLTITSLSSNVFEEGDRNFTIGETVEDKRTPQPAELAFRNSLREELRKRLTSQERKVLILKFGLKDNKPQTHKKIAKKTGIPKGSIYLIVGSALGKLQSLRR